MSRPASLGEIAGRIGGELIGDADLRVARLATLEEAGADAVAFLANPGYAKALATTRAGCVVVGPAHREAAAARGAALVVDDPYLAWARLTQWWAGRDASPPPAGVHPSACVDDTARLGTGVSIGAGAVVGAGCALDDGVRVDAHAVLEPGCRVGTGTRLGPRVTLYAGTVLGARCTVHAGAVLGADGFGFAPDASRGGAWVKIEQLGRVVVGDDVEIGANSCIDRGALGDTTIGDGVKIDNLVQIGHNVRIGAHTAIAGCVGIAGSAVVGEHCMIGGGAGINGHITIVARTVISGATQVSRSIATPGFYSGSFPFDDNRTWEKNAAVVRHLHELRDRVRALEKKP